MNDLQRWELADYRMKKAKSTFEEVALLVENMIANLILHNYFINFPTTGSFWNSFFSIKKINHE